MSSERTLNYTSITLLRIKPSDTIRQLLDSYVVTVIALSKRLQVTQKHMEEHISQYSTSCVLLGSAAHNHVD